MPKYEVTYTQYFTYEVDAANQEEAERIAGQLFNADMRTPIARTDYDDIDVDVVE